MFKLPKIDVSYTWIDGDIVHNIHGKSNMNRKLSNQHTPIIQTYHFSLDQVENNDITLDGNNCLACPFSYSNNNGESGGCYTHKGLQGLGIRSKLKSLHNNLDKIDSFSEETWKEFNSYLDIVRWQLVRLGAYGEPSLLHIDLMDELVNRHGEGKLHTGYTHDWPTNDKQEYKRFLMASVDSVADFVEADILGWRKFRRRNFRHY